MGLDMMLMHGRYEEGGEEVGYWRKANQIHKWFVDNVQDGVDDCGTYKVTKAHLVELYNLCSQVLNDHSLAESLLPSQSGFFFGSTDYDEWYYNDLENTKRIIDNILEYKSDCLDNLYYSSSW